MQHEKNPIMYAADCGRHELVEIVFPRTRTIPFLPDWSIDGIIKTTKYMPFGDKICNVTDLLLYSSITCIGV